MQNIAFMFGIITLKLLDLYQNYSDIPQQRLISTNPRSFKILHKHPPSTKERRKTFERSSMWSTTQLNPVVLLNLKFLIFVGSFLGEFISLHG